MGAGMTDSRPANSGSGSKTGDDNGNEEDAPSSKAVLGFLTLDDFDVRGKRVLLRVDINSPVDEGTLRVENASKIASAVPTVRELMDRGSRLTILAHQGRPGDYDFITLNEHADWLSKLSGKKIRYVNDIFGPHAESAIDSLGEGECILLQNVRNYSGEQLKLSSEDHAQSPMVKALSPKFDIFVNDAFASAHRSHASLVGFTAVLPSAAGRLMEKEVRALSGVLQNPARPSTFVFGGTKFADALPVIRRLAESDHVDHVLITGLAGYVCQWILGKSIGTGTEALASRNVTDRVRDDAKSLVEEHGDKITLPVDGAIDLEGRREEFSLEELPPDATILDIGTKTIERLRRIIDVSKAVFLSGPPGVYERKEFSKGTRELYEAIASSGAYSVIGGGHSGAAAHQLGMSERFSYISTGGGAIERMILGKSMPVIEALRSAALRD
jgi:phosphoglycerate kinase